LESDCHLCLSVVAGMVDVIGFLSLGLFTPTSPQPRGDRSSAGARWPTPPAQVLAVPVFIVGVAAGFG